MTSPNILECRIQTLYAPAAVFANANPILLEGEPATESDTGIKKIGDGVTRYNDLPAENTGGAIGAYTHSQSSPATVWTINHNLGYRPAVELFDSGSQEFDAEVSHPTVNQTIISLTVATSGFARLL